MPRRHQEQDLLPFASAPTPEAIDKATREVVRVAVEATANEFKIRIASMLDEAAYQKTRCPKCLNGIWVTVSTQGKRTAWDADATRHAETCNPPTHFKAGGKA